MQVKEAIFTRKSIGKVTDQAVDKAHIKTLLEAAIQAPNHHLTEPWKFFILEGEGRRPLGRTIAAISREEMQDPDTPTNQIILQKQEQKAFRAPVIIVAAVTPQRGEKIFEIEEIAAVSAGIQNMLLMAHDLGLAAMWRTGAFAYHPLMKKLFQLDSSEEIVGFVYVGHAATNGHERKRTPYELKTTWIQTDHA